MFKKTLLVLVIAFAALFAASCGERTYKADGVYTAFSTELQSNKKPQVTLVSVTIEDDKITDFFIDCYQSDFNADTKKYAFKNPKKTLGYKYGMHNPKVAGVPTYDLTTEAGIEAYKAYLAQNNKLEWFEQAELLENYFLEHDPATVTDISVVNGVTISNGGYTELAAEAIALAKEGKAQFVKPSGDSVIWATATVKADGKFETLELNTLQGTYSDDNADGVKDVFAWNAKNKQQLGYAYNMHNPKVAGVLTYDTTTEAGITAYKAYLAQNNKLEWFEQANKITAFVLANGEAAFDDLVVKTDGYLDLDASDDAVAGVTVHANEYKEVLEGLYNNFKK